MQARLSPGTRRRVDHVFSRNHRVAAVRMLIESCGGGTLASARDDARALERIRYAALKVSGGSLERLRKAVELASTDWRHLLVEADFAATAVEVIGVATQKYGNDPAVKDQLARVAKMCETKLKDSGDASGLDKLKSLGYLGGD